MLAQWRSKPTEMSSQEHQPITGWVRSINLKTRLFVNSRNVKIGWTFFLVNKTTFWKLHCLQNFMKRILNFLDWSRDYCRLKNPRGINFYTKVDPYVNFFHHSKANGKNFPLMILESTMITSQIQKAGINVTFSFYCPEKHIPETLL